MSPSFDLPPRDDRVWLCATCRIGVQRIDTIDHQTGETKHLGWQHARPTDPPHEPVPVELDKTGGEIRTVCDICGEPDPERAWATDKHDFAVQPAPDTGSLIFRDRGDLWLVCRRCVPLVKSDDLHALFRRRLTVIRTTTPERRITTLERTFVFERIRDFLETRQPEPTDRPF